MEFWDGFLIVGLVHLLAAISPGPDFVLVTKETLTQGKKAGILSTLGISIGLSFHIISSILGFSVIIANSANLLFAIKILGGCYLLYLGFKSITSKANLNIKKDKISKKYTNLKIVKTGIFCNILNPKALLYFVSLFTIVLSPNLPLSQLIIYGIWIMFIQFACFSFIVLFLSTPKIQKKFLKFTKWINYVSSGVMMVLGIKILATR